jgi:hypothetical protein
MRDYVVEQYAAHLSEADFAELTASLRRATAALASGGAEVVYVGGLFVPEDDACFHVFRGTSARVVRDASTKAGLAFQRVLEAVADGLREEVRVNETHRCGAGARAHRHGLQLPGPVVGPR